MKSVWLVIGVLGASLALGQDQAPDKLNHPKTKPVKSTTAPVTHAEAKTVFDLAWKSLTTGIKVTGPNPVTLKSDKSPITKNETLIAFKQIVTRVESTFKRSASPVNFNPQRLRKDLDQATLGKNHEDGFVMPAGPIVTGKDGTVSTFDFGDAVGVLLIRIADLAHMPSRKFSPALMGPSNSGKH
ncbi:MAG: hypothetical protein WCG75_12515 [Armatimonadota bacterium]